MNEPAGAGNHPLDLAQRHLGLLDRIRSRRRPLSKTIRVPGALLVAILGMVLGNIGTAYGLPSWVALLAGAVILWAFLRYRGTTVEVEPATEG